MEKRTVLLLVLVLVGCRGGNTKPVIVVPDPRCGDGDISAVEDCEGSNLQGATCQTLGFDEGSLACGECKYVTAQCSKRCGNGAVDPGEGCDGKLGVGTCATFGYLACTPMCQQDVSHCVPVLLQSGAALSVMKGGPALIADLEPKGLSDLVMAVPSFGRLETFGYTIEQGFLPGRKLSFGRTPLAVAAGDLDGDGRLDVASINDDGAIDRYLHSGSSFVFSTLADAGCASTRFLGAAASDAGTSLLSTCGSDGGFSGLVVHAPGAQPLTLALAGSSATLGDLDGDGQLDVLFVAGTALESRLAPAWDAGAAQALPSTPLAIAAGDFDADGDLDLAALEGAAVQLWENTGAGFASKLTFSVAGARELKVVDLDLDGRADVLWQLGDKVQLRRNQGAWTFSTTEASLGPGAPISLAVGDADGDGDPDIASTHSAGGDATVTYVLVNKVR